MAAPYLPPLTKAPAGAFVWCEIYSLFEHSGIYLGDSHVNGQRKTQYTAAEHLIVELCGSGLVRALSAERFLQNRSGQHLFIATDLAGNLLGSHAAAERACASIYTYQPYDLLLNNCHRFSYTCLTGQSLPITSFYDLKQALANWYGFTPRWQKVQL